MILRRLVCTPDATGLIVDALQFNDVVRILGIAVVITTSGVACSVRWAVLNKDGSVAVPNLTAQSASDPGTVPTSKWVCFMVNQQRDTAIADGDNALELSPGFLPPDLWLQPSEQLRVEVVATAAGPVVTQCVVSYLDAEPRPPRKKGA